MGSLMFCMRMAPGVRIGAFHAPLWVAWMATSQQGRPLKSRITRSLRKRAPTHSDQEDYALPSLAYLGLPYRPLPPSGNNRLPYPIVAMGKVDVFPEIDEGYRGQSSEEQFSESSCSADKFKGYPCKSSTVTYISIIDFGRTIGPFRFWFCQAHVRTLFPKYRRTELRSRFCAPLLTCICNNRERLSR